MKLKILFLVLIITLAACSNVSNQSVIDSDCEKYENEVKITCYYQKAIETKDIKYCYNLYSDEEPECKTILGREICFKSEYMDECITSIIIQTGDTSLCKNAKFENENTKKICNKLPTIYDDRIEPYSLLTCDGIQNDETRKQCINEIGLLSGNKISECEKLPIEKLLETPMKRLSDPNKLTLDLIPNNALVSSINRACYFKVAIKDENSRLCDSTFVTGEHNPVWDLGCLGLMAIHYDDITYCDKINEMTETLTQRNKNACINFFNECKTNLDSYLACTLEKDMCGLFSDENSILCNNI